MRNDAFAWILAAGMLGSTAAAQTPLVEWHEQVVPGACTLRFAVPGGWEVQARSQMHGAVELNLAPGAGSRAKVLITGTVQKGSSELKGTSDIKRAVRAMGEALLEGSVEKRLELEKLEGRSGAGFFYSLTDKRPELPEGDFRRMTQGIMPVGPLRLAVTVLSDQSGSAAQKVAFDLLRTADCEPAPAK